MGGSSSTQANYEALLQKYQRLQKRAGPCKRVTPRQAKESGDEEQAQLHKNDRLYRFLMKGPPRSGTYYIRPEKARAWVDAQITPERRATAQKFIDNTVYVTHGEFIAVLKKTIEANIGLFKAKTTALWMIVDDTKKSQYWVMLAARSILWHDHGIEVATCNSYEEAAANNFTDLVELDDCGYSGSQTQQIIIDLSQELMQKNGYRFADQRGRLYPLFRQNTSLERKQEKARMVPMEYYDTYDEFEAPIAYAHDQKWIPTKVHFMRIYCSATAVEAYRRVTGLNSPLVAIHVGVMLPNPEDIFTPNEQKIIGTCLCPTQMEEGLPGAMVYFDFKMADAVSTTAFALLAGLVMPPLKTFRDNVLERGMPSIIGDLPKIKHPAESAVDRTIPDHIDTIGCLITDEGRGRRPFDNSVYLHFEGYDSDWEEIPKKRIPPSWYKYFNFETLKFSRSYKKATKAFDE